jgi:hypothetical protein
LQSAWPLAAWLVGQRFDFPLQMVVLLQQSRVVRFSMAIRCRLCELLPNRLAATLAWFRKAAWLARHAEHGEELLFDELRLLAAP